MNEATKSRGENLQLKPVRTVYIVGTVFCHVKKNAFPQQNFLDPQIHYNWFGLERSYANKFISINNTSSEI